MKITLLYAALRTFFGRCLFDKPHIISGKIQQSFPGCILRHRDDESYEVDILVAHEMTDKIDIRMYRKFKVTMYFNKEKATDLILGVTIGVHYLLQYRLEKERKKHG